ncbi:hypothetical protein MJG53_017424 [Ovis ammon polii x Ovis aries]|uniref:Uncharacterized protein n=2 Tax=Ovis TaxID=9935 RepID=A0A836CTJ2_SHEEP|nr:hypothetical protein JEQ12_010518 [Ovis aries]KAI4560795.1 hypothetical protein MJG53_017424 [Ovis ammon polii x Ovis aries]
MNRTSQPLFTGAHGAVPPAYEMLKEEHEVAMLGVPQSQAPVMTTVINIRSETSVPDHIVWSLFNTIFMHWCCPGFVAFAYSVESRDRKMVGDISGPRATPPSVPWSWGPSGYRPHHHCVHRLPDDCSSSFGAHTELRRPLVPAHSPRQSPLFPAAYTGICPP